MKLSWGFIVSSLYCSASAASSHVGHVFLYDPAAKPAPKQASVHPETARFILAQRLSLSRFHSIHKPSDEVVEQINAFGGQSHSLFTSDSVDGRLLVWIEDVEDPKDLIKDPSAYSAKFDIINPPPSSANDRLIQDFILQAGDLPKKQDVTGRTYNVGSEVSAEFQAIKTVDTYRVNDYLNVFRADKSDKLSYSALSVALGTLLQKTKAAGSRGYPITVVLMPPSSSYTKRTAQPYGTYDLPRAIGARREKPEALLSPSSSQPSSEPKNPNPNVSDLGDSPVFSTQADDTPVLGILSSCFESLVECQKQTHNCSGHGSCSLTRKGETGKDARVKDCYGCQCTPTVVNVGGEGEKIKNKTTHWGGPACQKRDVSVPFWLFVFSGVLLAFLLSTGLGMLYSIGNEELPSVIGAGVSGPTRK